MISNNKEAPVPPEKNRGFQMKHEVKQREGWSLSNTGSEVAVPSPIKSQLIT